MKNNSKTTQNKFKAKVVIKHWLEGNSIKCYNKSGCLLRVETISDIDISILKEDVLRKYQDPVINQKGARIAAPDLRKEHQVEFLQVLLSSLNRSLGFKSKDLKKILGENWKTGKIYELRKLRVRGAVEKIKSSHYYRLTKEGFVWIFYSFFNSRHMLKPLLSDSYKKAGFPNSDQPSIIEGAYSDINKAVSFTMSEFKLVS